MSAGISKGGEVHPSFRRVAAISSFPMASPCMDAVPCLFGAPQPITVFAQISDGRAVSARAAAKAAAMASLLWPSTWRSTCQP